MFHCEPGCPMAGTGLCPHHMMFPGTGGPENFAMPLLPGPGIHAGLLPGVPPGIPMYMHMPGAPAAVAPTAEAKAPTAAAPNALVPNMFVGLPGMPHYHQPYHHHHHGYGHRPMPKPKDGGGKKDGDKKKKEVTEDDPPWSYNCCGQAEPLADDKSAAKAYLHQVLNYPSPIVEQDIHQQVKLLIGSSCKDQVIASFKRFLACGGVYSLRVLELLQHLPAEAMVGMLEHLELLADPTKEEWHGCNGRIITLAHQHRARGAAAKSADEHLKWDAFTSVVGKSRVAWPAPPPQLGWTWAEMFPKWDGKPDHVPPHMMQVLVPKYWVAMGNAAAADSAAGGK